MNDSITMANQLRSKDSKLINREDNITDAQSNHLKVRRNSTSLDDVKTPPLPSKTTIQELLMQRKSIKDELRKIQNQSENKVQPKEKVDVHSKSYDSTLKQLSPKKSRLSQNIPVKPLTKHSSPESTEAVDSENEERIIEQRRKKRKLLLEKLGDITENKTVNSSMEAKSSNASKKTVVVKANKPNGTSPKNEGKVIPDMFADTDDFNINRATHRQTNDSEKYNDQLSDNWDDAEGYYQVSIGDTLNHNRYRIKSLLGQGMFANVVSAVDKDKDRQVAIKIARNNDIMYRNGLKEIAMLKEISKADPDNQYNCVKILRYFMHKGHLCIVLESLTMDLRCVLKKFGKSQGIKMESLLSYSRQLLTALKILKRVGIIHADIKPDNILVNEKKNLLKLCDFGSAEKVGEHELKPYLVSRFYRAPEIILGLPYSHGIDMWSAACTIYELATGRILFTGSSNNKMLKCFMDIKGKFPKKMIKNGKFKDQHFNYNSNFLLHKKDEVTGRDKVVEISNLATTRSLLDELKKYCAKDTVQHHDKKLAHIKDLLERMLTLDSHHRPSVTDCLRNPIFDD